MTTQEKKQKIKSLVEEMMQDSFNSMKTKIDKAISSGAIDLDEWDEISAPMILPKCILSAILKNEATQYDAKGTSFEKRVKKEIAKIRLFI